MHAEADGHPMLVRCRLAARMLRPPSINCNLGHWLLRGGVVGVRVWCARVWWYVCDGGVGEGVSSQ